MMELVAIESLPAYKQLVVMVGQRWLIVASQVTAAQAAKRAADSRARSRAIDLIPSGPSRFAQIHMAT